MVARLRVAVPGICRRLALLAAGAALSLGDGSSPADAAPTCRMVVGARVVLQSDAVDPDVFLWDSRARLVAYASGGWDSARDVMEHTVLANSGTFAMVVACAAGAAHPRYSSDAVDAVGVRIVRGTNRGRVGWIVATDARVVALPRPR